MKTTIISNTYDGQMRICQQTVEYTKSDDLQTLGNLYFQLANITSQIADAGPSPQLLNQKSRIESEIETYRGYIAEYPEEEDTE